jgi:predicted DCC family thiol-disulfide oxidoreductase YuxK
MKTTMFYDGQCPVCMRGVRHYRRLDWAGRLAWADLTDPRSDLESHGLEFAAAMDILHVRDRDGLMHQGGYAFAALWAELPVYRWLALVLRSTGLVAIMDRAYRRLARGRYARRCAEGVCDPAGRPVSQPAGHG